MKKKRIVKVMPKSPEEIVAEFLGSGIALAGFDEYYAKHTAKTYSGAPKKMTRHTADELAEEMERYYNSLAIGPGVIPCLAYSLDLNFV